MAVKGLISQKLLVLLWLYRRKLEISTKPCEKLSILKDVLLLSSENTKETLQRNLLDAHLRLKDEPIVENGIDCAASDADEQVWEDTVLQTAMFQNDKNGFRALQDLPQE